MANLKIEKDRKYRIKGKSEYFMKEYGTYNPIIYITKSDKEAYENGWFHESGCHECWRFARRIYNPLVFPFNGFPDEKGVWVGEIGYPKELVHESELEEI